MKEDRCFTGGFAAQLDGQGRGIAGQDRGGVRGRRPTQRARSTYRRARAIVFKTILEIDPHLFARGCLSAKVAGRFRAVPTIRGVRERA